MFLEKSYSKPINILTHKDCVQIYHIFKHNKNTVYS